MAELTYNELIKQDKVKKAIIKVVEFLESKKVSKDIIQSLVETLGLKAEVSTGTGKPREITVLKDKDGNIIGRKCSVSKKWYPISEFYRGATIIKEVEKQRNAHYNKIKPLKDKVEDLLKKIIDAPNEIERGKYLADYKKAKEELDKVSEFKLGEVKTKGYDTMEELKKALETANTSK